MGEAEGVSHNSRQSNIIISVFTVHTRPLLQRMLLFDGVNLQESHSEGAFFVAKDAVLKASVLPQRD